MSASASLPAQVVFAQPVAVVSGPGAPGNGIGMHHHHHHHSQQHGHLHHNSHSQHVMSPPPLPPAGPANVSYSHYVSTAPGAGAGPELDGHHAYAHTPPPYLPHSSDRRLPSIRDLDFGGAGAGGHNNLTLTQQHQHQHQYQQHTNAVPSPYNTHPQISPTNSVPGLNASGRPPPVMTSGPGMSGPGNAAAMSSGASMSSLGGAGSTSVPTDIVMTPIRQRSGHFRLPSNHTSAPSSAPQQHSPNLSGYAQPQGYPTVRRQRADTGPGGGVSHTGRPLSSAGMSLTSPVSATGRSPLVSQTPYGYPTPHNSATSSLSHHQQATTPHSPYTQAFPSPHTPHHHLHTPSSLGPHPPSAPQSQPHQQVQHASQQQQQPYDSYEYGYGGYQSSVPAPPSGSAYPPPVHTSAPASSASAQYTTEKQQQQQQGSWTQQQPLTPINSQSAQPYPSSQYTFVPSSSQSRQAAGMTAGGGGGGRVVSAGAQAHQSDVQSPQMQYAPPSNTHGHGGVEEMRAQYIKKIQEHCYILYNFAKQYENTTGKPTQSELDEMTRRAQEVVTMLAYIRRLARDEAGAALPSPAPEEASFYHQPQPLSQTQPQDHAHGGSASTVGAGRGSKRSWVDVGEEDDEEAFSPSAGRKPSYGHPSGEDEKGWDGEEAYGGPAGGGAVEVGGEDAGKSSAEKDMALIRRKRATQQAPQNTPKGKYRKRSRATPPGKCHSCNIRETPEWRRGPDGARTLCNACGLHYAKLCRKREKARQANDAAASLANAAFGLPPSSSSSGDSTFGISVGVGVGVGEVPPEIDMETLRKSTRAANERELAKADRERSRFRGAGGNGGGSGGDVKGESSDGGGEGDGSPTSNKGQTIGLGLGGIVPHPHQTNGVDMGALGINTGSGGGDGRRPGTAGGDSNGGGMGPSPSQSQSQWRPYAEGQSSYVRAGPAPASSGVRTGSAARVAATSA